MFYPRPPRNKHVTNGPAWRGPPQNEFARDASLVAHICFGSGRSTAFVLISTDKADQPDQCDGATSGLGGTAIPSLQHLPAIGL